MPPIFGEPEPEPPPPSPLPRADCEETYNQVNDENSFCSLRYECDDDELEAQCTWRDDHWDCICEGLQFRDSYELVGVETTTACGVIVDLCFSGTATAFDGPEQCVDTLDLETDSCELLRDCKASADLGGGVVVSQVISTDYNRCSGDATSLSCSCQVGGFGSGVVLTGAAPDAACGLLFDVCGSDSVANFSPAGECTRSHRRSEDTVCEASESCTLQSAVGSGVSAEVNTNHNINCHDVGEEDWECRCNGAGTATFSWTVAATSEETCNGALDVCAMASALPQTEPTDLHVDCEDNARVTGGNNCGHTDLCSVEVDVAGVEVNVENFVYTNCYQTGEGEFACSCSSWVTQAAFEHTSAASLRDVCAEVAPTCNSMANIRLDPY